MENDTLNCDDFNENHIEDDNKVDEDIENEALLEEETMDLKTGLDFGIYEELYEYYGRYGNEKGFPVMKRSSKKRRRWNNLMGDICMCKIRII
ncbi:hypothetical protein FRX31_033666 [Thalictrum thalictroides]|uniref:FAR1 domain-containing protein n=1 Tax=Thalictrum thalictroides TaxID=46969 RepID=A0A7J6UVX5_THATH|nr:hypothetical protein FRX31_033666 [Thalictrum thalictroides]